MHGPPTADAGAVKLVIRISDLLRHWPWPRAISPHYEECKHESDAWFGSFHAFSPEAQVAFNKCNFSLLGAMAYARLNREGCRIGCDLMNLYFFFDEHSDLANEDETRQQADAIMDALRDPHKPRPQGEWVGGRVTQQFWLNAIKSTPESVQRRFIDAFQRYSDSVIQQSLDRDHGHQRDIQSYLQLRRYTGGTEPSYPINLIHSNLPDYVLEHPTIKRLEDVATDMIIVANDIYSYNREQSRPGHEEHNAVSAVMAELGLGVQEAMDWLGCFHDKLVDSFLAEYQRVPQFPDESERVNLEVLEYADALGNWVRACDQWSFESERYFGNDGRRVFKERTITLRPKVKLVSAPAQDLVNSG
ncbi:Delta(6)-protoilludene synthase [Fusarium falciforme]